MAKSKNKRLVIVESPAKARTLSTILGDEYDVRASVGHVRDLPKSKLGVRLNLLTMTSPERVEFCEVPTKRNSALASALTPGG